MTSLLDASHAAMAQMSQLVGATAEAVSELERAEGGMRMHVEVVEVPRIPPTTSILASYEVETDEAGNVLAYRRFRRYTRSEVGSQ
ncbi:MAG TPA: gas vesicle protein GvpO [Candidatus Limnocylindrales bacterium]